MQIYHSEPKDQPTIGNYLMYGFILVTVVVFVADQILQHRAEAKKRIIDKNEKHKQNILNILKMESVNGQVFFEGGEIRVIHSHWAELHEDYHEMISHLSSYGDILLLFEEAMKYSIAKIESIQGEIDAFNKFIDKRLASISNIIGLSMSEEYHAHAEPHCYTRGFKDMIYTELMNDNNGISEKEKLTLIKKGEMSSLMWGNRNFAHGNEESLEKLLNYVRSIKRQYALLNIFKDLVYDLNQLKENKALQEFEVRRKSIVRDLDKGQKDLKGRCGLCP